MIRLKNIYKFDLRALALFRIGLAGIIITDYLIRLTDLEAHYTDQGVLPLKALFEHCWNDYHFSVHAINGLWGFQLLLFLAGIGSALAVLIGYRTKTFTFISWLLVCSLHNRNPMILQGGDDLLRMGLFWGLFLPWQRCYSVDERGNIPEETTYSGLPALALLMQVCYVYFFSALEKSSAEWTTEGTALYYALSLDQMVMPLGKLIYWYPELLRKLTHSVYYIELLGPFLLAFPYRNQWFRMAGIILFTGFQVGIGSTLFVGLFYLINIVMLLCLFPTAWMDWLDRKTTRMRARASSFLSVLPVPAHRQHNHYPEIKRAALLACMIYVTTWNIGNTPQSSYTLSPGLRWPGHLLRLDQNWGVFAPGVIKDDGWYVLPGTTANQEQIDLYRDGKPVSYWKPENVLSEIKNDRWRKYGEQMIMSYNSWMRGYYCNYTKRKWNEAHPGQQVTKLEVVYMMEFTRPGYSVVIPSRESLCTCGQ